MELSGMGMGALFDGEWESLCKLLTFDELNLSDDQFLSHGVSYNLSDSQNSLSQDMTSSYDFPLQISNYENYYVNECKNNLALPNDAFFPMNFSTANAANDAFVASLCAHEDGSTSSQTGAPGRMYSALSMEAETEKNDGSFTMPPRKKARASKNKGKKTVQLDGKRENKEEDHPIMNGGSVSQSVSVEVSDEASNCSQENSEGENSGSKDLEVVPSKGKKRASRGTATDPQSLYARKRRERINERLRILQNLVPNGTKVDISTMLEEAVHYVKFLQLQIRLLSSDDLWMYAPIAYNGVDISLYKRISPFLLP